MKSSKNIRVALVEDDRSVRDSLATIIDRADGFSCVAACRSGEEALLQLPSARPDVVLMDIHLPEQSGIECVAYLSARLPLAQCLMLTVEENSERVFDSLKAGASGYLVKNVHPDKILEAIAQVHAGGAPMSSHIARMVISTFRQENQVTRLTPHLSPREDQVLRLLASGLRTKEIADNLGIGTGTVSTHIRHIYEKLHVRSRAEAVTRIPRL